MKFLHILFFVAISLSVFSQGKSNLKEYHVSVNGNDANEGSVAKPFKTISAAANVAMPGDVITVHTGVFVSKLRHHGEEIPMRSVLYIRQLRVRKWKSEVRKLLRTGEKSTTIPGR